MMTKMTWGMGVAAVAGSLAMMSLAVSAQTTAPVAPTAPPKAAAPAAAPAPAAAAPKAAAAPVTPAAAPKAAAAPAVVCKGKDETSCKTEASACAWIVPTKVEANGKADKAYCRRVAGIAKRAADAKKATTDALAKAGAAAKAAVTPAPAATAPAAPAPAVKKN